MSAYSRNLIIQVADSTCLTGSGVCLRIHAYDKQQCLSKSTYIVPAALSESVVSADCSRYIDNVRHGFKLLCYLGEFLLAMYIEGN